VLNAGRIEQAGPPDKVYDRPASVFVHRFLGSVNQLEGSVSGDRIRVGPIELVRPERLGSTSRTVSVLVRPHEIEIRRGEADWPARVKAVRVLGSIVRVELALDGVPDVLEAELSRERYERDQFVAGDRVGAQLRRWEVYEDEDT
jgi:sulfate transport system ATP-binding protein